MSNISRREVKKKWCREKLAGCCFALEMNKDCELIRITYRWIRTNSK